MKDTGIRRFHFSGFKGHTHCVRAKAARLKTGDLTQGVETKPLPAGAGRFFEVVFQILKYDIVCDGAAGG